MAKRFCDLSIMQKMSVVPLAMTLILATLATYAFVLLGANESDVRGLENGILKHSVTAIEFQNVTERTLSNLYRLTSVAANETDEAKLAKMAKEALAFEEKHSEEWPSVRAGLAASGIAEERLHAFDDALAAYVKAAKNVINMAGTDAGMALAFMTGVQGKFTAVSQQLDAFIDTLDESRDSSLQAVRSDMRGGRTVFTVTIGFVIAVAMALSWAISRAIAGPLTSMVGVMKVLANGNAEVEISGTDRGDEIGTMAATVRVFRDHMVQAEKLHREQEEGRVQQELERQKAHQDKLQALRGMAEAVERETRAAVSSVSTLTKQMSDNASNMSNSAGAVSDRSRTVTGVAAEALANVQTVAAAAEQLSASIQEISNQVNAASKTNASAVKASHDARATIAQLSEAVTKIGVITKLISEIAEQTNLLALNATIEAARAGDAGKGFAVVAGEVKSLANQTANATGEIASQIAAVQNVTAQVVETVTAIADSIGEIESVSSAIAAAVEQQSATTSEIARSVSETAVAVRGVSEHITHVSNEAIATESCAGDVKKFSSEVAVSIDDLRRTLIRIVRTSTAEVERRHQPRFRWERLVKVMRGERPHDVRTANLSRGGVMLLAVIPGANVGDRLEMKSDDFTMPLAGTIVKIGKKITHVQFALEDDVAKAFATEFEGLFAGQEPLARAA